MQLNFHQKRIEKKLNKRWYIFRCRTFTQFTKNGTLLRCSPKFFWSRSMWWTLLLKLWMLSIGPLLLSGGKHCNTIWQFNRLFWPKPDHYVAPDRFILDLWYKHLLTINYKLHRICYLSKPMPVFRIVPDITQDLFWFI